MRVAKKDLEIQVDELHAELLTCNAQLRLADKDCKKSAAKIEAALARLKHHVNNRKHVQSSADLVDLIEYQSTLQSIKHIEIELEYLEQEGASFFSARSVLLEDSETLTKEIEELHKELAKYGQLINFPTK